MAFRHHACIYSHVSDLCDSAAWTGDEQRSTRSGLLSADWSSHGEGMVSVATKADQRHNWSCSVPGKFCIHFFLRLERELMLFEVEVAFIVQPDLVPKQFLQGNSLSLYFLG